jgi:hypothetical protein
LSYHYVIGVLDVLPEFFRRQTLAEDARDFQQPPDVELAIPPKLEGEVTPHRKPPTHRESNPVAATSGYSRGWSAAIGYAMPPNNMLSGRITWRKILKLDET